MVVNVINLNNTLQFLSNLDDIQVASSVDYSEVTVTIAGSTTIVLDEKLYPDASGKVIIYDVRGLLMPYVEPGKIVKFEIEVENSDQTGTDITFDIVYCNSRIITTPDTGKSNADLLKSNWLTSAPSRLVSIDMADCPLWYYGTGATISCSALVLYNGSPTQLSGIGFDAWNEGSYYEVDAAPNTVIGHIESYLESNNKAADPAMRVISYMFSLQRTGCAPSVCRYDMYQLCESDILITHKNQWGLDESLVIRGAADVSHDTEIESAYIGGKLSRINSNFKRSESFVIPVASEDDMFVAEQIASSSSIKVFDKRSISWIDCVVTGVEQKENTMGGAENSYTITYQPVNIDHRSALLVSGSRLRQGSFDTQHDSSFA